MKPQTLRVLKVLRQRPVTLADFDCQPACDGGDRITRLGARIQDLKDDGYRLRSQRVGHIARYTLIAEPQTSSSPASPPAGDVRHGAHREDATALDSAHETADKPAPSLGVHPAARAQLQDIGPQLSLLDGMAA